MKKRSLLKIGLTGSVAMGKSTAAQMFADMGLPVFCADQAVHDILAHNKKIAQTFPEAIDSGVINRKKLGQIVFEEPAKLKKLENILHPLVEKERKAFLAQAKKNKESAVLFDIPLLFEIGGEKNCDVTLCVSASATLQKQRALKRKNMTPAQFRAMLKNQLSDAEKRRRADYVIRADKGKAAMRRQIKALWQEIKNRFLNA